MERRDFVIIGAGAAGEAAAYLARERGASVAIIDRDLFGGSCAYWACMPSKTLLHGAAVRALGGDYPWEAASARRDWMINREGTDYPSDHSHVAHLEEAGALAMRGTASLIGPGRVSVDGADGTAEVEGRHVILAVGSDATIPPIEGLDDVDYWTNRQGTATRELPESMVILGGGPSGVELAQAYARYGTRVSLVDSNEHILAREHPRSAVALEEALRRDGVEIRTGVRARRVLARGGADGAHRIELSDGSVVDGERLLLAVGRTLPVADLGLERIGVSVDARGRLSPDEQLRVAPDVYLAGDVAGPEMHTHVAHYQGELAVRIALGDDVVPDYRAIPRATYTDPETASVGVQLQEARAAGHDAFEETADVATTARGYVSETGGHVSVVVDRRDRTLLGAFIAGSGASETIHEAVLAIKTGTPVEVLADTIHAFPTLARVLGSVFMSAHARLRGEGAAARAPMEVA